MNLTHPSELKELLNRHGFAFSKSLGQNFLTDQNVLDKIADAADIKKHDCVLEIGPGAGTLTACLAARAEKIAAIEIDSALIPILNETMADFDNFTLIHNDVMKVDLKNLTNSLFGDRPFCVAANLPYYITTPIVMMFLENHLNVKSLTLMVQKEVADRMTAKPGGKDYGALSVAVGYYTEPSFVCKAEPHCFMPQPKVASSVVNLKVKKNSELTAKDEGLFFKIVKSAFGQRRKTLVNALSKSPYITYEKDKILFALESIGLDASVRGERLSIEQFVKLSDILTGG